MKNKPVFMHIPKTGGASIGQLCMHRGIGIIGHDLRNPNYVSLAQYRQIHPEILSFAIVRNPWDRLVSAYHFLSQGGLNPGDSQDAEKYVKPYGDFNEFVSRAFINDDILSQLHFHPQYKWISDENGIIADYVGRFEQLQFHVSRYLALVGMPDYRLQHVNRTTHKHFTQYYTRKSIEIVGDVYSRDIRLFGYKYSD